MGSIHHLTRFIPHLALRPLLKNTDKHKTLNWSAEHESSFQKIKMFVAEITKNKYSDQNFETHVVCDASTYGMGAAVEQKRGVGSYCICAMITKIFRRKIFSKCEGWVAIAYASSFLKSLEEKYSVNYSLIAKTQHLY